MQTPTYFTGSDVRIREPDLPLLYWALAFKGASWTDPDAIPLMVIQSIIGAWNKNAGAGAAVRYSCSTFGMLHAFCVLDSLTHSECALASASMSWPEHVLLVQVVT